MATFRTSRGVSVADPSVAHLILVGLPGVGKSAVGSAVAERLGRSFLDFDVEIERREQRTISQIFGESGEFHFRRKETELTREVKELGNMILAPGGGWIMSAENVSLLRPPGKLVYLRAKPETIVRRLGAGAGSRPLLSRGDPLAELKRLLNEREQLYGAADVVVNTELHSLQEVIDKTAELASIVVGK